MVHAGAVLPVLVDGDEAGVEHLIDGVLSFGAHSVLSMQLLILLLKLVVLFHLSRDLPLHLELPVLLLLDLGFGFSPLRGHLHEVTAAAMLLYKYESRVRRNSTKE